MTGYRTLIANVLTALVGIFGGQEISQYVSTETVIIIVTVGNIILRFLTKTPVGGAK